MQLHRFFIVLFSVWLSPPCSAQDAAPAPPQNIVLIVSDDQGTGTWAAFVATTSSRRTWTVLLKKELG